MKNKFYIIYEDYTDYNQFEGTWETRFQTLKTKAEAMVVREELLKNCNVRDVSPILFELR